MLFCIKAEESRVNLQREILDLRRQLNEHDSSKSFLEMTNQELCRQLRDTEAEKLVQNRALIEVRERLERIEKENHKLKQESEMSPKFAIPQSVGDILTDDLKQKLADCEHEKLRLQEHCTELRTNLDKATSNLEDVKEYVWSLTILKQ